MASPRADDARTAGALEVGDVLADRYTLLELLPGSGSPAQLWRAHDEVLARPVAVRCLPTPNKAARDAARPFLDAAVRTGAATAPGLARTYDAAIATRGRGKDVAYVIGEWVDAEPLDAHLSRVGALAAVDAADLLRQVADALAAAHAKGLIHGRLHPRNVLVTGAGRVRLTDTHVSAALRGLPAASVADDTRDLAALGYALVTRRWPAGSTPQPAGSLSPAPHEGDAVLPARQLRAGVPRALDTALTRALEPARAPAQPPLRTPAALADAVDAAVADLRVEQAAETESEPTAPGRVRRALPWVAAAVVVGVVGIVGWTAGLAVGDLPGQADTAPIVSSSLPATSGTVRPALPLEGLPLRDFDPLGKDREENPDQVQNAVDGSASTAWVTQAYKTADFSGLKPGVGLLLDLRKPTDLHTVVVAFTAAGADVEVRVADTAPTALEQTRVVAAARGKKVATLQPVRGTRARYVLVWITRLPQDGKSFRVGVSELRLS